MPFGTGFPDHRVNSIQAYLVEAEEEPVLPVLPVLPVAPVWPVPPPGAVGLLSQPIVNIPKLHNTNKIPNFFIAIPFILWMAGRSAHRCRTSLPLTIK